MSDDNKLLNIIMSDDLKHLSMVVSDGDYSKEDLKDLANYFTALDNYFSTLNNDGFIEERIDSLQKCVDILIPIMYDIPTSWGDCFASWVVHMGVDKGDWRLFNEGLAYLALDSDDNQMGGGFSLLQNVVMSCKKDKLKNMPQIKEMIKLLAEKQKDKDGMALLRCVQMDYLDLFDAILPHSNIAAEHYFVYYYACGLENEYYIEKLKPLVDEVEALYGVEHKLPYLPVNKEKDHFKTSRERILKSIEDNPDNKNKKLLLKIYNKGHDDVISYIKENNFSNDMLIKMLEFAWDKNKKTYDSLLDIIPPGNIDISDVNKLMARNMDKFKIHIKPYDKKSKQSVFFNASYFNNKEAMTYFIENEFSRGEIIDLISTWKVRGESKSFFSDVLKKNAIKPSKNLKELLIEYDKNDLNKQIKAKNEIKENKKI